MRDLGSAGVLLALSCLGAAQEGRLRAGVSAERVLFLGNSITRHGPAPKIGWTGDWGMAASALEKDYVHLTARGLEALAGKKPEIRFANIADFERNPGAFDLDVRLKAELDFRPTLVILAVGENVPALKSEEDKARFKASLDKLLGAAKTSGAGPSVVVRSCFWADAAKDDILRKACAEAGGSFVDIAALGKDASNYARAERSFDHAGVAAHPGDKGMAAIADAILRALRAEGN